MTRLAVVALLAATALPAPAPYQLQLDGVAVGELARMGEPAGERPALRLEDGWVERGSLEAWWNDLAETPLGVGTNRLDPADCAGRRVAAVQRFGDAPRQRRRQRAWTLLDACPVEWVVQRLDDERVWTTSITFTGTEAVAEL